MSFVLEEYRKMKPSCQPPCAHVRNSEAADPEVHMRSRLSSVQGDHYSTSYAIAPSDGSDVPQKKNASSKQASTCRKVMNELLVVVGHYFVWHARVLPNVDTQSTNKEKI